MIEQLPAGGVSADTQALLAYESNKRSVAVSYVLWFFLGLFGAHRFYNGRTGSGVAQLLLAITGFVLTVVLVGFLVLVVLWVWVLVDAFLIPGWVRDHNNLLVTQLVRPSQARP